MSDSLRRSLLGAFEEALASREGLEDASAMVATPGRPTSQRSANDLRIDSVRHFVANDSQKARELRASNLQVDLHEIKREEEVESRIIKGFIETREKGKERFLLITGRASHSKGGDFVFRTKALEVLEELKSKGVVVAYSPVLERNRDFGSIAVQINPRALLLQDVTWDED